jgi:hypothetical protein
VDYAEMIDNEAKMAKIYKFSGQELMQVGHASGMEVNDDQEAEQRRHIDELLHKLPEILPNIRNGHVDPLALFRDTLQSDEPRCKICEITQLNPLEINKMNALNAANLVETSMIGLVNPRQLALNKMDIFNMYQVGLAAQGGKCDIFVTEADILIHNKCCNNPLFIQNENVTLLRAIVWKLQNQLIGTIETPTGQMPYTNIKRINTLLSVMRELNKAIVTFQTSKRLILNALNRGETVADAFTMVGGLSSSSAAGRRTDGTSKKPGDDAGAQGRGGQKPGSTGNLQSRTKGISRIDFGNIETKAGSHSVI